LAFMPFAEFFCWFQHSSKGMAQNSPKKLTLAHGKNRCFPRATVSGAHGWMS